MARERERERVTEIHTHTQTEKERDRHRDENCELDQSHGSCTRALRESTRKASPEISPGSFGGGD